MRVAKVGLLSCLLITGCARTDTKENVQKALEQANLKQVAVDLDRDANIVHLKGTVGTMADRTRAEEVAAAAVGTSGRVLNELTVEGLDAKTADDLDAMIEDRLNLLIDSDSVLKERDITIEVHNGAVTVTGEVRSAEEKRRVSQILEAAPGVRQFANALDVIREP